MTVEDIKRFMSEHPGEMIPLFCGGAKVSFIHPEAAIDILTEDVEVIDVIKRSR